MNINEIARNLSADKFYFLSQFGLGDTYFLCAFKEILEAKFGGKIIFIIQPSHEIVLKMFEDENYILADDARFKGEVDYLNLPNFTSVPKKGSIFPAHPLPLGISEDLKHENIVDMYEKMFDLPKNSPFKKPTFFPKISPNLRQKLEKIAPLDKIILFCPEAQSLPSLPYFIYAKECRDLQKMGFCVVVNALKEPKYATLKGVINLNLSLEDAVALSAICGGVISMRSGFCDLIALNCINLKVYFPSKECLKSDSLRHHALNSKAVELIFPRLDFLEDFKNSLPLKLFERYAAKGFLRRLRTPFSCYKIYRKFDKDSLNFKKFSQDEKEFLSEVMETYEFQLGLLLQNACGDFWRGFLIFPFKYLNLRKNKKNLARLNEFLMH